MGSYQITESRKESITAAPAAGTVAQFRKHTFKPATYTILVRQDREPEKKIMIYDGGHCGTFVCAKTLKEAYKLQDEAIKELETGIKIYTATHRTPQKEG